MFLWEFYWFLIIFKIEKIPNSLVALSKIIGKFQGHGINWFIVEGEV